MNKQKLILPICIILGCVLLVGFYYIDEINKPKSMESQNFLSADQQNNSPKNNNQSNEDALFNKNLECQKLRPGAEIIAASYDIYGGGYMLSKIFYSPLTNSCVFSFTHTNSELGNLARQYYKLYNLFSSELLINKEAVYKNDDWDNTNELFTAEVKKYE